jgi:hypothetical protein
MEPRFKPGETVWILWQTQDIKTAPCPFCGGECEVPVEGKDGTVLIAKCPSCKGEGEIQLSAKWRRTVERRILDRVQLAVGIPPAYAVGNRWCYEVDALRGGLDQVFASEADAQASADKWNAEQKEA